METLLEILLSLAGTVSGLQNTIFAFFTDSGALSLTLAAGVAVYANIPAEVLANIRRWHGKIDEQFDNISNLVNTVQSRQTQWAFPQTLLDRLVDSRSELAALIPKCRSNQGSAADRTLRNTLLKTTVGLCLTQVKTWAFTQYYAGVLTVDDVHLLGFFVPGESGGRRERKGPTDVLAEVKVSIINTDFIRVVIDQAAGENAALVAHGWPAGVRTAKIVILAADGKTEVHSQLTSHLHTDIRMPETSRGKQFLIKAAFLAHVDDEPRFGPQPTFSMPLTTEDLVAAFDRQHHEDFEAQMREVERHRQEVERLREEVERLRKG